MTENFALLCTLCPERSIILFIRYRRYLLRYSRRSFAQLPGKTKRRSTQHRWIFLFDSPVFFFRSFFIIICSFRFPTDIVRTKKATKIRNKHRSWKYGDTWKILLGQIDTRRTPDTTVPTDPFPVQQMCAGMVVRVGRSTTEPQGRTVLFLPRMKRAVGIGATENGQVIRWYCETHIGKER